MKHSILILADAYGKPAYAPRLRSLCDYLQQHDWQIDVYTETFVPLNFSHQYPIHEINLYRNRTWDWTIKAIWSLLTDWKNRHFSKLVRQAVSAKTYDMVFCTTFSTFPLRAALDIATERHIPLHVDLRDIDEQVAGAQYQAHRAWYWRPFRNWYKQVNIHRRNRVLRKARQLTTVSPWHCQFLQRINPNTHLIYNGFDKTSFYPKSVKSEQFTILYTGRIYESVLQDPTLLFEALQHVQHLKGLQVAWYTNQSGQQRIKDMALEYGVSHLMVYHDYVNPTHVPPLLHQCSIALVLSNKTSQQGPHGILGTKFFEYLGVEKPVLCVRSDEGTLAQTIDQTHAGLAATNVEQIVDFIQDKYQQWQQQGYTHQAVTDKERFTRQEQALKFERLFLSLIA